MALLNRSDWYDIARDTNWQPSYVRRDELFPPVQSGDLEFAPEIWNQYDEPYKVSYREYVNVQREKDAGIYGVKTAAARTRYMDKVDDRWHSVLKFHFGGASLGECCSQWAESRMARFAQAPGMRNMATFGLLDEIRHGQSQLFFCHENIAKDMQYSWGYKFLGTHEWGAHCVRAVFDDYFLGRDVNATAIMLTSAFETAFTNMQFLGLAADAAEQGDVSFSNLISSIQTDEARHAQIGGPLIKLMVEHGYTDRAQQLLEVGFWRTWRMFSLLTGCSMDYFTPLERRTFSFKEFMEEWIIDQFERSVRDLGLKTPWFWDYFIKDVGRFHHGMQLGLWTYRQTVWFNVPAGVSKDEREWLEEKYPGWNDTWGKQWDVITDNILRARPEDTLFKTLVVVCSMSQLPIVHIAGERWDPKEHTLNYQGRNYYFQSAVDRWVFQTDPERYKDHLNITDMAVRGLIQPMTPDGALNFMGLSEAERGGDSGHYAWAESFRTPTRKAGTGDRR